MPHGRRKPFDIKALITPHSTGEAAPETEPVIQEVAEQVTEESEAVDKDKLPCYTNNIITREGVVCADFSACQVNILTKCGLACLKKRDSCIAFQGYTGSFALFGLKYSL